MAEAEQSFEEAIRELHYSYGHDANELAKRSGKSIKEISNILKENASEINFSSASEGYQLSSYGKAKIALIGTLFAGMAIWGWGYFTGLWQGKKAIPETKKVEAAYRAETKAEKPILVEQLPEYISLEKKYKRAIKENKGQKNQIGVLEEKIVLNEDIKDLKTMIGNLSKEKRRAQEEAQEQLEKIIESAKANQAVAKSAIEQFEQVKTKYDKLKTSYEEYVEKYGTAKELKEKYFTEKSVRQELVKDTVNIIDTTIENVNKIIDIVKPYGIKRREEKYATLKSHLAELKLLKVLIQNSDTESARNFDLIGETRKNIEKISSEIEMYKREGGGYQQFGAGEKFASEMNQNLLETKEKVQEKYPD